MSVIILAIATLAILLSIFLGDYIGRGKRELFDQPRGDDADGLSLGGSDNLKSIHSDGGTRP